MFHDKFQEVWPTQPDSWVPDPCGSRAKRWKSTKGYNWERRKRQGAAMRKGWHLQKGTQLTNTGKLKQWSLLYIYIFKLYIYIAHTYIYIHYVLIFIHYNAYIYYNTYIHIIHIISPQRGSASWPEWWKQRDQHQLPRREFNSNIIRKHKNPTSLFTHLTNYVWH